MIYRLYLSVAILFFSMLSAMEVRKDFLEKHLHMSNMIYKSRYTFKDDELLDPNVLKMDITAEIKNIVKYELKGFLWVYLIKHGLEKQVENKQNLLFYIVDEGKLEALNVVLDYYTLNKEMINVCDSMGKTVLHHAVHAVLAALEKNEKLIRLDIVKALCSHNYIDRNCQDKSGKTVFDYIEYDTDNGPALNDILKQSQLRDCSIL